MKNISMRFISIIIFSVFIGEFAQAQTQQAESQAVMDVVLSIFEGMRLADSSMIDNAFHTEASMYTATRNAAGEAVLVKGDLKNFLTSVAKAEVNMLNEPLWDYEVRIDNNFAAVWTKYAFYYGNKFSHCGVDAFHLLRTTKGWKVFHLVDTRQKEGCEVPAAIKEKFEKP